MLFFVTSFLEVHFLIKCFGYCNNINTFIKLILFIKIEHTFIHIYIDYQHYIMYFYTLVLVLNTREYYFTLFLI